MGAKGKNFYNDYAKRLGYEEAAEKIQDLYLAGSKAEAMAAVPDSLVDEIALVGPPDRVRDRLSAWKEAGKKGPCGLHAGGGHERRHPAAAGRDPALGRARPTARESIRPQID